MCFPRTKELPFLVGPFFLRFAPRRGANEGASTNFGDDRTQSMRVAIAACWLSACSACLLHGRRAAVRPRGASRLMATASADLELEMAWCARVVREAADMLVKGCVDMCSEALFCTSYAHKPPAACTPRAQGSLPWGWSCVRASGVLASNMYMQHACTCYMHEHMHARTRAKWKRTYTCTCTLRTVAPRA